jgi:hypothetical protein
MAQPYENLPEEQLKLVQEGARVHARRKVARLTTKWATRLQVAAKVSNLLEGRVSRGFAMLLPMPLTLVKLAPEPNKKVNFPLPDNVTLSL